MCGKTAQLGPIHTVTTTAAALYILGAVVWVLPYPAVVGIIKRPLGTRLGGQDDDDGE